MAKLVKSPQTLVQDSKIKLRILMIEVVAIPETAQPSKKKMRCYDNELNAKQAPESTMDMSYTFFHSMKKSPPTKTNTWHKHAEKEREGEPDTAHVDHCMGTLDAVGTVGAIARMEKDLEGTCYDSWKRRT